MRVGGNHAADKLNQPIKMKTRLKEIHGQFVSGQKFSYEGKIYQFLCNAITGNYSELRARRADGSLAIFSESRDWKPVKSNLP
jgi:hypothetical protein